MFCCYFSTQVHIIKCIYYSLSYFIFIDLYMGGMGKHAEEAVPQRKRHTTCFFLFEQYTKKRS